MAPWLQTYLYILSCANMQEAPAASGEAVISILFKRAVLQIFCTGSTPVAQTIRSDLGPYHLCLPMERLSAWGGPYSGAPCNITMLKEGPLLLGMSC
mmetsp:Transcript_65943/g.169724  ORF Transcript_65943/g.169724 Transcript_65943/m.169724 type:complete len:97 (-) Transcript_65943:894-1184(-)